MEDKQNYSILAIVAIVAIVAVVVLVFVSKSGIGGYGMMGKSGGCPYKDKVQVQVEAPEQIAEEGYMPVDEELPVEIPISQEGKDLAGQAFATKTFLCTITNNAGTAYACGMKTSNGAAGLYCGGSSTPTSSCTCSANPSCYITVMANDPTPILIYSPCTTVTVSTTFAAGLTTTLPAINCGATTPPPTPTTHKECINGRCTSVSGAGTNQCTTVGMTCTTPTLNSVTCTGAKTYSTCYVKKGTTTLTYCTTGSRTSCTTPRIITPGDIVTVSGYKTPNTPVTRSNITVSSNPTPVSLI